MSLVILFRDIKMWQRHEIWNSQGNPCPTAPNHVTLLFLMELLHNKSGRYEIALLRWCVQVEWWCFDFQKLKAQGHAILGIFV